MGRTVPQPSRDPLATKPGTLDICCGVSLSTYLTSLCDTQLSRNHPQLTTMKTTALFLVAAASIFQCIQGHSMDLGRCHPVEHLQGFKPDDFTGVWYVIEIFSTTSHCMTMTFNRTATGFKVTEGREFALGKIVKIDHTFTNTGTFTITDPAVPAKMDADWPSNFISKANVMVVDTDYTTFAVLFECQPLMFLNRHSAVILSRERTLANETVQKVKQDLSAFGLDISDFDIIDHRSCNTIGEADFNWGIDEDTFNVGNSGLDGEAGPTEPAAELPDFINEDPTFNEVL